MFYEKPSSAFNLFVFPFETQLAVHQVWARQSRILLKTKAVGALFCKTVRATH